MVAVHVVGTIGYHAIGAPAATWVDSFYMTFITVATIGYSEVVDLTHSPWGRLFTVGIALVGIVTMTYLFSTFLALLIESDINNAFRRRRMEREISGLQGHYIVCGIGRVGSNVAQELVKTQRRFAVIESNTIAINDWLDRHPGTLYVSGDAAEDDALRRAGVENAAGVFAVTGDDSHNLMIALSVKLLNPKCRVVARLHDVRNAAKARKAGADEIVSPDFTGGMRIASAMVRPHVVNFMDQMLRADEGLRVEEVVVPPGAGARRIGELAPRSADYLVMAAHDDGSWVFNPQDDHVMRPGAALVVMTHPSGRARLEQLLNKAGA
ncbi:potassium channel protein [Ramlibacter sp. GTP1]|uniref:Potassium channel protein n=2 Tax=Ramlibacter albus TaxID=2079448 RepID=A0A923MD72_9BURK|nr:potassium channel protein [Ramlibacter albus]MBC5767366.1 potassium channel protein [Ramlibacter albus]